MRLIDKAVHRTVHAFAGTGIMLLALAPHLGQALPLPGSVPSATPVADKKGEEATGIQWQVEPAHVQIILDGKKLGEAGALKFTGAKPGKHTVKLTNGKDETEMDISVKKGQTLKFAFTFDAT